MRNIKSIGLYNKAVHIIQNMRGPTITPDYPDKKMRVGAFFFNWCPSETETKWETSLMTWVHVNIKIKTLYFMITYRCIVSIQLGIQLFCRKLGFVPTSSPPTPETSTTSTLPPLSAFPPFEVGLAKPAPVKSSAKYKQNFSDKL